MLGGAIGAGLGWALSSAADVVIRSLVQQSSNGGGGFFGPGDSTVVYTPPWLPIFAIAFATVIGLVSGVYPALRAATLDPLCALKGEQTPIRDVFWLVFAKYLFGTSRGRARRVGKPHASRSAAGDLSDGKHLRAPNPSPNDPVYHGRRSDRLTREAVGVSQTRQRGVQRLLGAGVNPQQRLAGLGPAAQFAPLRQHYAH